MMPKLTICWMTLVGLGVLISTNFAFAESVTKIRLVGLKLVDGNNIAESDLELPKLKPLPESLAKLLEVEFSSDISLRSFAKRWGANIYAQAVVCGKEATFEELNEDLSYPGIADSHGQIFLNGEESSSRHSESQSKNYRAFLTIVSLPNRKLAPVVTYNFLKRPESICFNIGGGDMLNGLTIKSNTIKIEARTVSKAIAVIQR
jgi:hypothetical protein